MSPNDRPRAQPTAASAQEATRRDIIEIAMAEFAKKGLNGARVDEIALRTRTSKRMIYYYFGGKEQLYIAVLEEAYRRIREVESTLRLDHLPPEEAIRALVGFTFDYDHDHPDFVRLVMTENIHLGRHLARSERIRELNVSIIDSLRQILARGQAAGRFRPGIDPIELHATISALCFFDVANQHTFSLIFKRDVGSPAHRRQRRATVIDTVLRYVMADCPCQAAPAPSAEPADG